LKTVVNKVYEAMFLVDSVQAAADWDGTESFIKSILEKADAKIISFRKWDERKLAYDIDKKSRGTYILAYFNAPADKITQLERDVQLSEKVMRVLILKADHLTKEDMEKETPLMIAARVPSPEQVQESAAPQQPVEAAEQKAPDILADLDQPEQPAEQAQDSEDKDKPEQPDVTI
jgi:small subunit ribosomal protein S6